MCAHNIRQMLARSGGDRSSRVDVVLLSSSDPRATPLGVVAFLLPVLQEED